MMASPPTPRPASVAHFEREVRLSSTPAEVFEFCRQGENFQKIYPRRITPCRSTVDTIVRPDGVYCFVDWMGNILPVRWVVRIAEFVPDQHFVDEQVKGPFRYFRHTHLCLPDGSHTVYRDSIDYCSYFGRFVDDTIMRRTFERIFEYRHSMMKKLLDGN